MGTSRTAMTAMTPPPVQQRIDACDPSASDPLDGVAPEHPAEGERGRRAEECRE